MGELLMVEVFRSAFRDIMNYRIYENTWWISQAFAFLALIVMFWSFQIKDKLKMMLLLGLGTTFLAVSASFLDNWTLTVLFALASVRNYVFCFFEWRALKERPVARWWWYFFGGVFISGTVASTIILVHIMQVPIAGVWVEWLICITLIGLIVGNVITGTDLMRLSFVANRTFNIINHWYFYNVIAVIIACLTISSNIIFYVRMFFAWRKQRKAFKTRVTVATDKAPGAIGPYSQATVYNGIIYVSGQLPLDPVTGELHPGDIGQQTHQVMSNIAAIVEAAGGSMDRLLKVTILLTDINDFVQVNEAYAKFFAGNPPARVCYQVSALPKGASIEIDAICAVVYKRLY